MPRSGVKDNRTPAQARAYAKALLLACHPADRESRARLFLHNMITTPHVRYSLAQMRAMAEGFEQVIREGK